MIMRSMIEYLVKSLVDDPDHVLITETACDGGSTAFEVRVAADDIGKVIGRGGRIASAIRQVVKAAAMKEKQKIYVDIIG